MGYDNLGTFAWNPGGSPTKEYVKYASMVAEEVQSRYSMDSVLSSMYQTYRGDFLKGKLDTDAINVNVTFGHTKIMESLLYYQDPYFRVRPNGSSLLAPAAQLIEMLLNRIWRVENIGRQVRRCIVDASLTGIGWMLPGFSNYHDPNLLYRKDRVYCKRVNPLDLYTEGDIEEYDDATWYARRGLYSTRWLKKLFGKTFKPDTAPSVFARRGVRNGKSTQATVWELVDIIEQKLIVLSPQHQCVLYKTDYPYPYYNRPMYIPLIFAEDPERLQPISFSGVVDQQQTELDNIRTQQMRHRKRYNRRYVAQKNAFDEAEMEKIEEGEDGCIALSNGDPRKAIWPILDAPLDQGITMQYQADIKSDMREIQGINEYMAASAIPRTKSSKEASMIEQGSNIRSNNLEMCVREFNLTIASCIVKIIQHEFDGINNIVKVKDDGSYHDEIWTSEDIAGDYEVECDIGSTLPPEPIPWEQTAGPAPGEGGAPSGSNQGGGMPEGTVVQSDAPPEQGTEAGM